MANEKTEKTSWGARLEASISGIVGVVMVVVFFGWIKGKELQGMTQLDDCREVVKIKRDSYLTYFKDFVCSNRETTIDGVAYNQCVNIEFASGIFSPSNSCKRAYVYLKRVESVEDFLDKP